MNERKRMTFGQMEETFLRMRQWLLAKQEERIDAAHALAREQKQPKKMQASNEILARMWSGDENTPDEASAVLMNEEIPDGVFGEEKIETSDDDMLSRILLLMMQNGNVPELPATTVNNGSVQETQATEPENVTQATDLPLVQTAIEIPASELKPQPASDTSITVFEKSTIPAEAFEWPESMLLIKTALENMPDGHRRDGNKGANEYVLLQALEACCMREDTEAEIGRVKAKWGYYRTKLGIESVRGSEIGLPKNRKAYQTIDEAGMVLRAFKTNLDEEYWLFIQNNILSPGRLNESGVIKSKNTDETSAEKTSEPEKKSDNLPDPQRQAPAAPTVTPIAKHTEQQKVSLEKTVFQWIKTHPHHHRNEDNYYIPQADLFQFVDVSQNTAPDVASTIISEIVKRLSIKKNLGAQIGVPPGPYRNFFYIYAADVTEILETLANEGKLNHSALENRAPKTTESSQTTNGEVLIGNPLVSVWGRDFQPETKSLKQIIEESGIGNNVNLKWLAQKIIGNVEKGSNGISYVSEAYVKTEILDLPDWEYNRNTLFQFLREKHRSCFLVARSVGLQYDGVAITVEGVLLMTKYALEECNANLRN